MKNAYCHAVPPSDLLSSHCHYDWWMSNGAAACHNLVLKLASGPRKMMVNWIADKKKNTKTAGLHLLYRAIDQALDQMDLSIMDSIIQYTSSMCHPLAHPLLIKP